MGRQGLNFLPLDSFLYGIKPIPADLHGKLIKDNKRWTIYHIIWFILSIEYNWAFKAAKRVIELNDSVSVLLSDNKN